MKLIFMVLMLIPLMMNSINYLTMNSINSMGKMSPFECGFDPKISLRSSISLHFFILMLIFLIFDIEISVLVPFPLVLSWSSSLLILGLLVGFMIVLALGTIYEWNLSSLDWKI